MNEATTMIVSRLNECRPRLSCLDVDGTLVDEHGDLYDGAAELVAALASLGPVALCSARPFASLVLLSCELKHIEWLAASQGTLIAHRGNHSDQWQMRTETPLTGTQVAQIAYLAARSDNECFYHTRERWLIDRPSEASRIEASVCRVEPSLRSEFSEEEIYKVSVVAIGEGARLDPEEFRVDGLRAMSSKSNYLEITASDAPSGKGAEKIAALTEIGLPRTLTLGDAENDVGMLSSSGIALTFIRAPETIRAVAHFVLDNPEDGGLVQLSAELKRASNE